MKKEKKKRQKTIKFRITMVVLANVSAIIILLCLFNTFYFEKYYMDSKQGQLKTTYKKICSLLQSYKDEEMTQDEYKQKISRLCEPLNISAIVIRSDWVVAYASASDVESLRVRMEKNLLGVINEENIIVRNKDYIMQRVYDSNMKGDYLEIFGYVNEEDSVMLRLPIKSITDSVAISNSFIIKIGFGFLIIALINSYFVAVNIAKPIRKISALAERMSDIKFDTRYQGQDEDEIGILGTSLNILADRLDMTISELKTANNELKNDIESKEQLEIARTDFIANVSHELKTPIALIQGYAEGLKEGIYDSPENAEYYCDVIMDEARKMNQMVKQLLSLNQLESGGNQIVMEKINITELVNAIVSANSIRANQNDITMRVDIRKHIVAWADEFRIEEVVTNYVSNAINHCQGEKIITIRAVEKADTVRIIVKNTGNQIPEDDIEHIWDKFYKVDKARTREYGGNGIGLSIVKAIMEAHNKEYGVNNVSDGVEFWFELDTKLEM